MAIVDSDGHVFGHLVYPPGHPCWTDPKVAMKELRSLPRPFSEPKKKRRGPRWQQAFISPAFYQANRY
jgi:hypothetical protein